LHIRDLNLAGELAGEPGAGRDALDELGVALPVNVASDRENRAYSSAVRSTRSSSGAIRSSSIAS
jgi:hypothetical protein